MTLAIPIRGLAHLPWPNSRSFCRCEPSSWADLPSHVPSADTKLPRICTFHSYLKSCVFNARAAHRASFRLTHFVSADARYPGGRGLPAVARRGGTKEGDIHSTKPNVWHLSPGSPVPGPRPHPSRDARRLRPDTSGLILPAPRVVEGSESPSRGAIPRFKSSGVEFSLPFRSSLATRHQPLATAFITLLDCILTHSGWWGSTAPCS